MPETPRHQCPPYRRLSPRCRTPPRVPYSVGLLLHRHRSDSTESMYEWIYTGGDISYRLVSSLLYHGREVPFVSTSTHCPDPSSHPRGGPKASATQPPPAIESVRYGAGDSLLVANSCIAMASSRASVVLSQSCGVLPCSRLSSCRLSSSPSPSLSCWEIAVCCAAVPHPHNVRVRHPAPDNQSADYP
jgi:hypothetical protein